MPVPSSSFVLRRNQKMVALLGDENLRIHMGSVGRERVERVLSWQHEAPRLLAAYENLLGDRT